MLEYITILILVLTLGISVVVFNIRVRNLEKRIQSYEKVLLFYANESSYKEENAGFDFKYESNVLADCGKLARSVLINHEGNKETLDDYIIK